MIKSLSRFLLSQKWLLDDLIIAVTDRKGIIRYAGEKFIGRSECDPASIIGMSIFKFIKPSITEPRRSLKEILRVKERQSSRSHYIVLLPQGKVEGASEVAKEEQNGVLGWITPYAINKDFLLLKFELVSDPPAA